MLNSMNPCSRRIQASSRRTICLRAPVFGASGRSGGVQARTGPAEAATRAVGLATNGFEARGLGAKEESVKAGGVRVQPTYERITKTGRRAYVSFS